VFGHSLQRWLAKPLIYGLPSQLLALTGIECQSNLG